MIRVIKFRAWDKKNKKYRELGVYDVANEKVVVRFPIETLLKGDYILEQYTGIKDKNGKEIYEGDIIKQLMYVLDGKECITTWVVRWNNDEFCYELHRVSGKLYGDSMLSTCESKDCEVIGNIHENPELLGGEE